MKNLLFLLLILFTACKKEATQTAKQAVAAEKPSDNELVQNLYQYYISNPTHPAHHEQNTIIDYAVSKELPLTRTESGLFYFISHHGDGLPLSKDEMLTVDYKGMFLNGKTFDSSYSRGEPIEFKIGQMIAGWNEGLTYMKHGDHATFVVPSYLAYGKDGFPGLIGPDEILTFELVVQ